MTIIALSGYARSGKDTCADILVEELGFQRAAFADVLRACVEALNPIVGQYFRGSQPDGLKRYNDVLREVGYDKGKELYPEFREILQRMGTEVGRDILGANIWVDLTLAKMKFSSSQRDWILTDCRFPNEAAAVRDANGQVWRVERPGVDPANDHVSEHALDDYTFDVTIENNGTLEDLKAQVLSCVPFANE